MARSKTPTISTVRIAPSTLFLIVAVGLGVFALLKIWGFILVVLTAVVIAAFVKTLSRVFVKLSLPRIPSVVLVYILLIFVFVGLMYMIVPIFLDEVLGLVTVLPLGGLEDFLTLFGDFANAREALGSLSDGGSSFQGLQTAFSSVSGEFAQSVFSIFGGLFNVLLILIISFYLALQRNGVELFLRAVTPVHHEAYVVSLWMRTERKIGLWFRGQLLSAFIVAVLTFIGLQIFDVEYALLLSAVAGVFGLIPYGIVIAVIPAVVLGFLGGGFQLALIVLALYWSLQQVEEYLLRPLILNRVTGVPSLVILLAIVAGAKLLGFLGLFLGLPAAIMIMEALNDYEERKMKSLTAPERKKIREYEQSFVDVRQ